METVHEFHLAIPTMQQAGLRIPEIVERLINLGGDNKFTVHAPFSGDLPRLSVVEVRFTKTGVSEVIHFDGKDWHHLPSP